MRIALVQLPPVTPLKMKYDDQMNNSDGNKQEIGIVEFLTLMKKLKSEPIRGIGLDLKKSDLTPMERRIMEFSFPEQIGKF